MQTFAIVLVLLGISLASFQAAGETSLERRGHGLASRLCGACHAIGPIGKSPRIGAPPFRMLDRQLDLDAFAERLRDGLMGSHRDMPFFRFARDDAHALVAYLRSVQGR